MKKKKTLASIQKWIGTASVIIIVIIMNDYQYLQFCSTSCKPNLFLNIK